MNEKYSLSEYDKYATEIEWSSATCDRYDYLIAASCGAIAGLIDIIFVGCPADSTLGKLTEDVADELVKKFAKLTGWSPSDSKENSVSSAIRFLEKNFGVNYDHRHSSDVDNVLNMSPKNHHYKSLGHSPDPIGLFFAILDQFTNQATFIDGGKIIRIDTSDRNFRLQGSNFISKLFCGFCNWLGHIMSDLAGRSDGRGAGKGRGTGVPMPFMELFQLCNFGSFNVGNDMKSLAEVMTAAFEQGYDARFAAAQAIPVIIGDVSIRVLWSIKQRYYHKKDWKECVPIAKHADLRIMLLVGGGTLCLIDGADALIRGGGNPVAIVLHLNYVAWIRLLTLVFKELCIRYGAQVKASMLKFINEIIDTVKMTVSEQKAIREFCERIVAMEMELSTLLNETAFMLESEYRLFCSELAEISSPENASAVRAQHSVVLANMCNVDSSKILTDNDELDKLFR